VLPALSLGACATHPVRVQAPSPTTVTAPAAGAAVPGGDYAGNPALQRFIERMVAEHGFAREYLIGLFSGVERQQWTLDYLGRERVGGPPAPGAWSRYRAKFLTTRHIGGGARFWAEHAAELRQAQERYGVPPEYVVGILGVETVYGGNVGRHRVLDSLTTLAMDFPRRADYFTGELESFLLMARSEGIDPAEPVGSYAGAMGLGQFMPGSFLRWAVDFDGDGRRDLWAIADAIGSVANYLAAHGWRAGEPVVTPARGGAAQVTSLQAGFDTRYALADLARHGLRPAAPEVVGAEPVSLLRLSTYAGDEYWLGHGNFYTITRYNHSTHYAMAVHELAQEVRRRHDEQMLASAGP
jgi:membrane-bound lytic murein transglycosylase B